MRKLIAAVVVCVSFRCAAAVTPPELGLIERVGDEVYFYFATATLAGGTEVVALDTDARYRILGLSDPAAAAPLVLIDAKVAYPYTLSGASDAAAGVAAIVDADAAHDADDVALSRFRTSSCLSSEGMHFSVWRRDGAGDGRVWSAYRPLDYTATPTCTARELAD